MKLVTYDAGGRPRSGVMCGNCVVDLEMASEGGIPGDMVGLLSQEGALERVREIHARGSEDLGSLPAAACGAIAPKLLLAPVLRPGKICCLGLNYGRHAAEGGAKPPDEPIIFSKAPTSVIGPGRPIVLPEVSKKVDYEVELGVVIGRRAKLVSEADAMDCVAGYCVLNDVSARDYQLEKAGGQWYLGKSFDTFCPLGPWMVTKDDVPDPHALSLECEVSGEVLQSSSTSEMLFSVPAIIAYLSRVFTLEPGDVIGTGTPSGVGYACKPPRYLRPGDVVRCTVEGIGTLENPVEG